MSYSTIHFLFHQTCKEGAQTTVYCAVSEEVKDESGNYYMDCQSYEHSMYISKQAYDEGLCKKIWEVTETLTELNYQYNIQICLPVVKFKKSLHCFIIFCLQGFAVEFSNSIQTDLKLVQVTILGMKEKKPTHSSKFNYFLQQQVEGNQVRLKTVKFSCCFFFLFCSVRVLFIYLLFSYQFNFFLDNFQIYIIMSDNLH